jgi:hypothetical protein
MGPGLKNLLKGIIAAAFLLAAEPGLMPMPPMPTGPQMAMAGHVMMAHGMTNPAAGGPCMAKNSGKIMPNDCIGVCAGMFTCYGVTALAAANLPPFLTGTIPYRADHPDLRATGLTRPPENPPPIA